MSNRNRQIKRARSIEAEPRQYEICDPGDSGPPYVIVRAKACEHEGGEPHEC